MTESFKAKLAEFKSREIINVIEGEIMKADTSKKNVTIEYEKTSKVLTYNIIGRRSQIDCIWRNVDEQIAEKVIRAFK